MGQTLSTRSLRTFVLRQGRLTAGQQKNLDDYWHLFGVDVRDKPLDLTEIFGNDAPVCLEIGFGNGESMVEMAAADPARNFIGIEVHLPGAGHVLGEIAAREVGNLRVVRYDAVELLDKFFSADAFDRVQLFFPDPWPKKRHHKRRIVNDEFLRLLQRVIRPGGLFHVATDWEPYARHIEDVVQKNSAFSLLEDTASIVAARPRTKFESRGLQLGHRVTDLVYRLSE